MRGATDVRSYYRIFGLVRKLEIEVIHGHGGRSSLYAAMVARLARKPAVASIHSRESSKHCGWTHRVIAANEMLRRQLLANRLFTGRIEVVYAGVPEPPADLFARREAFRRSCGLEPKHVAVAVRGPLGTIAEHRLLIDAVERLAKSHPTIRLCVIGGTKTEHAATLKRHLLGRGLMDHVYFIDQPRSSLLPAMDVFVLADQRNGAYLSVIEACAVGIPVLASMGTGINEVVKHGETGLLFVRGDGPMLTAMLRWLADAGAWRVRLGANARQRYLECFTLRRMAKDTERVYRAAAL